MGRLNFFTKASCQEVGKLILFKNMHLKENYELYYYTTLIYNNVLHVV